MWITETIIRREIADVSKCLWKLWGLRRSRTLAFWDILWNKISWLYYVIIPHKFYKSFCTVFLSSNCNTKTVIIWSLDHTLITDGIKVCCRLHHLSVIICVKLPPFMIFLWLMLKFTAPERKLKLAFHDVFIWRHVFCQKHVVIFIHVFQPSIANATNIDTLLVATEKEDKMTAPPEALQDKIGFVFNNLSQLNLQTKVSWIHCNSTNVLDCKMHFFLKILCNILLCLIVQRWIKYFFSKYVFWNLGISYGLENGMFICFCM